MKKHTDFPHTYLLAQAALDGARRYYKSPKNPKDAEITRQARKKRE